MRGRLIRALCILAATGALALPPVALASEPHRGPVRHEPAAGRSVRGAATTVRVRIRDNVFRPRRITIQRGTRVRWVNRGNNPHTTTSNRGLWDSGILSPGESFTRRFRRTGTFRYHCEIHVGMTGRVVVVA
ncbi:MAG TPA: cupredoxin domain-containing protein [Actinomycetota bacterium]|nr:cupredoxin domain-containing protein [Actinomycetota bacterium]